MMRLHFIQAFIGFRLIHPTQAFAQVGELLDVDADVGRYTSIQLDKKDCPVIAYHDLTNRDLKLARCGDFKCEKSASVSINTLDSEGFFGMYTSMVLDDLYRPLISYYDGLIGTLKILRCFDPECSEYSIAVPDVSDSVHGLYSSILPDFEGNPVVSYYDDTNGDLKILRCGDPSCLDYKKLHISSPDSTGDVGMYSSIVLDSEGLPVISYHSTSDGLKLMKCDDSNCHGDESENISIPDPQISGWYSTVVLSEKDYPIVSYFDSKDSALRVLLCDDTHCDGDESGNIKLPDPSDNVGAYVSMAINEHGHPVFSYYDLGADTLKVLMCDDRQCEGDESNNIRLLSSDSQSIGQYNSIAVDRNGIPVVSFYDFSSGDLRIVRCSDGDCS